MIVETDERVPRLAGLMQDGVGADKAQPTFEVIPILGEARGKPIDHGGIHLPRRHAAPRALWSSRFGIFLARFRRWRARREEQRRVSTPIGWFLPRTQRAR